MSDPEHIERPMQVDFADQLQEVGLVPPTIQIGEVLQTRMQRHNRTLMIDDLSLMDGVREVESERAMVIFFDSLPPKSNRVSPQINFDRFGGNEPPRATLRINPNITQREADKGADRELNSTFWLGVLVNQAVSEGEVSEMLDKKKSLPRQSFLREWSVPILGNFAVGTPLWFAAHVGMPLSVGAGIGTEIATWGYLQYKRGSLFRMSDDDFLRRHFRDGAQDLAASYPVVRQDFLIEELGQ